MVLKTNYLIKDLDELNALSKNFLQELHGLNKEFKNIIVFFEAQMGSGKTTFIRQLVKNYNPQLKVSSPTFIGMHLYENDDLDFYHYDLYQVSLNLEEFEEILSQEKNKIIFFEWAENLDSKIKESFANNETKIITMTIETQEDESRAIVLKI